MDIFDGIQVVARWWFVTLPILVLAIFGALAFTANIDPEYTADGSMLLEGPNTREIQSEDTTIIEPINPLLEQPSALITAVQIAAIAANGPIVAETLASEGLSTSYEVGAESRTPILLFEVRAETRELATATALRIADLIDEYLQSRQDAANAREDQRITTSIISLSATGGADYGGRSRIRLAMVVLGAGIAFGAAFLLEGLRTQRLLKRQHREREEEALANDPTASEVEGSDRSRDGPADEGELPDGHEKRAVVGR